MISFQFALGPLPAVAGHRARIYLDSSMVIWFFTIFTPLTSFTILLASSFVDWSSALPLTVTTPYFVLTLVLSALCRAMVQQRHLDQGGDGGVIDFFTHRIVSLFRSL